MAAIARRNPGLAGQAHEYISARHTRKDETFNIMYRKAHDVFFVLLSVRE